MLFRLRAAGIVTPYRAAGVVGTAGEPSVHFESQVQQAPEEKASPVRRFLNALRRLTGGN